MRYQKRLLMTMMLIIHLIKNHQLSIDLLLLARATLYPWHPITEANQHHYRQNAKLASSPTMPIQCYFML